MSETKTYWCVTSKYDDHLEGWSGITDKVVADKKPENTFVETEKYDIYNDWFDSYEEAEAFVRSLRRGNVKEGV